MWLFLLDRLPFGMLAAGLRRRGWVPVPQSIAERAFGKAPLSSGWWPADLATDPTSLKD